MEDRRRPIYSLYEDDPDLEEEIDAFVVRLAEAVDQLQDAESVGDVDHLDDLATAMAGQAARLGFPDLEKEARRVRTACEEVDKPSIQSALVALTDVARRIRQGHRGAA
jgi:hypothetical protein